VFAEIVGHSPYKVNAPGTYGYGGGIDGSRLAYQQVNRARTDSNIEFFNLATHNRSSPPGGVNTKLWEWQPSISGKWLLFGRIDFRTGTSPSQIVLFNLDTKRRTVLDHAAQRCGCIAPGQVNGHFVTWTKYSGRWQVYEYDISTGKTRVLGQPRGTDQYDAAVSASGTVYFARAGTKCGANVRLMAKPLTGPAYPLLRLPHGVDLADFHMFAYIDDVSATHLLYSRTACTRSGQGDVYRLDGITS